MGIKKTIKIIVASGIALGVLTGCSAATPHPKAKSEASRVQWFEENYHDWAQEEGYASSCDSSSIKGGAGAKFLRCNVEKISSDTPGEYTMRIAPEGTGGIVYHPQETRDDNYITLSIIREAITTGLNLNHPRPVKSDTGDMKLTFKLLFPHTDRKNEIEITASNVPIKA